MDDELRGLLARYARGELSADDARRAILRYPKWRVAEIDGELETVALDDGTPMLIAEFGVGRPRIFRPGTGSRHRSARRWPVIRSRRTVGFGVPARCAARAAELGAHGRARGCRCQTGPRPAGFAVRRAVVGCRLPGHRPARRSPRRRVGRHHDHDRAGRGGDIPANRATPRTRRRAVGSRTLGATSPNAATSTAFGSIRCVHSPSCGRRTSPRCWSPDAIRARTPSHCPPARLPKSICGWISMGRVKKARTVQPCDPGRRGHRRARLVELRPPGDRVHRVAPASDTEGLGSVPSRILCAGKLR